MPALSYVTLYFSWPTIGRPPLHSVSNKIFQFVSYQSLYFWGGFMFQRVTKKPHQVFIYAWDNIDGSGAILKASSIEYWIAFGIDGDVPAIVSGETRLERRHLERRGERWAMTLLLLYRIAKRQPTEISKYTSCFNGEDFKSNSMRKKSYYNNINNSEVTYWSTMANASHFPLNVAGSQVILSCGLHQLTWWHSIGWLKLTRRRTHASPAEYVSETVSCLNAVTLGN